MAWLIESSHKKDSVGNEYINNGSGTPLYLTVNGSRDRNPYVLGKLMWSTSPDQALHFGRAEDGYLFLQAVRGMMNKLPYSETLIGLRPDDEPPFVREHL